MLDFSKPIQTRDGRPVLVLCTDAVIIKGVNTLYSIVALVPRYANHAATWRGHEVQKVIEYRPDGLARMDGLPVNYDLVNAPIKRSTFQNIYDPEEVTHKLMKATVQGNILPSETECIKAQTKGCIGILRRDYEDDVFVGCSFIPIKS